MTGKKPWTQGEKALMGGIVFTAILSLWGYVWWQRVSVMPSLTIPTPTMPSAFNTLHAAAAMQTADAAATLYAKRPSLAAEKAALRGDAPALRLARRGLAQLYQAQQIRSALTTVTYYAQFRSLARLFALDARVKAAHGDNAAAMGSSLDAVQEGILVPRDGDVLALLVGIACEDIGRRQTWPLLDHLSAAQARTEARRLERIEALRVSYAATLQETEWTDGALLQQVLHKPQWRQFLLQDTNSASGAGLTWAQGFRCLTLSRADVLDSYIHYMNDVVRDGARPYVARVPAPPLPVDPRFGMDFSTVQFKEADDQAQNALLMVTLALRAYRLEHGSCPATLTALVPTYLSRVPDDPFALSGPLRYTLSGRKCVLYSVGPDGRDDGGRPIFDATKPTPLPSQHSDQRYYTQQDSKGDFVAGVNVF